MANEEKLAVLTVAPNPDVVRGLEILARARHTLIHIESHEQERVGVILDHVAERLGAKRWDWTPHRGFVSPTTKEVVKNTRDPEVALELFDDASGSAVFHFQGFTHLFSEPAIASRLRELHVQLARTRNLVVFSGEERVPKAIADIVTHFTLPPLTTTEYHALVSATLRELRTRANIDVALGAEDVAALLEELRGLSLFEVQKVVAEALVEDRRLDVTDLARIRAAKMRIVESSGLLEYTPKGASLADVAGLERLKAWVRRRAAVLRDPVGARAFGVEPPRGLLLLGVQGCGKSLCAKAIAQELAVPLLRLDPSSLYDKYFGESEKNLRRVIRLAEAMAPVVLWIDELEKAFASVSDGGNDGGLSHRLFGTFLTWLAEKRASVFVVATANDVSRLPPELVRKGRFDEIFFVDLPSEPVRRALFVLHLARRGHDASAIDVARLANETSGWSGSEIEQAVTSALYAAFDTKRPIDTAMILGELRATTPLSRTMHEKVDALRAWARDRAVPADADEANADA